MRHVYTTTIAASLVALLGAGCLDAESDAPTGDELAGESDADGESIGKADDLNRTFTFYNVEPDYRRCVFPLCGGSWVSRVNRSYTRCANGTWAERCYVAEIDYSGSGLSERQSGSLGENLLLRATMDTRDYGGDFGAMGVLSVSEAWVGESDNEPSGLFTRVSDSGVRCVTAPCFGTLHEAKLNSWLHTNLDEIDLDDTGVADDQLSKAFESLYSDDGLIVAGYRYWFWNDGWHKGRWATQYYRRVQPEEVTVSACVVGGCSGQVCHDEADGPVVTTCEWREVYACYDNATCERQTDGNCGWTMTTDLEQCIDDATP